MHCGERSLTRGAGDALHVLLDRTPARSVLVLQPLRETHALVPRVRALGLPARHQLPARRRRGTPWATPRFRTQTARGGAATEAPSGNGSSRPSGPVRPAGIGPTRRRSVRPGRGAAGQRRAPVLRPQQPPVGTPRSWVRRRCLSGSHRRVGRRGALRISLPFRASHRLLERGGTAATESDLAPRIEGHATAKRRDA